MVMAHESVIRPRLTQQPGHSLGDKGPDPKRQVPGMVGTPSRPPQVSQSPSGELRLPVWGR